MPRQTRKTYLNENDEYLKYRFSAGNAVVVFAAAVAAVGAFESAKQKLVQCSTRFLFKIRCHTHTMRCKAHNLCLYGDISSSNSGNGFNLPHLHMYVRVRESV